MTEVIDLEDSPTPGECQAMLHTLFPDMCPDYLKKVASDHLYSTDRAVNYVLDLLQRGKTYDKIQHGNKRKREPTPPEGLDEASTLIAKYDNPVRHQQPKSGVYLDFAKKLISQEYPRAKVEDIKRILNEKHGCLLPAYLAVEEIALVWAQDGDRHTLYQRKKTATAPESRYLPASLDDTIRTEPCAIRREALEELKSARQVKAIHSAKRGAEIEKVRREEENFTRAQADGTTAECECCFADQALNRMVHCDGLDEHLFCVECARRNAEVAVGMTQYELTCMSTSGCNATFSMSQRKLFLDEKLIAALDRIEYEAVLRLSGIENLEQCPFCPFVAEYPPIEEDREFRCANTDCRVVSCRLCKESTHIPRSCEEMAREKGGSARLEIEEAMSQALIRKCNKCQTPFIKEYGCNKMACTRPGCGNIQCYVCSKSCEYNHFDDASRGGKAGNCPLFDSQDKRHEEEVSLAEAVARQKVSEQNPQIDRNLLQFHMSQQVVDDEARRQQRDPQPRPPARGNAVPARPPRHRHRVAPRQQPLPPARMENQAQPAPLPRAQNQLMYPDMDGWVHGLAPYPFPLDPAAQLFHMHDPPQPGPADAAAELARAMERPPGFIGQVLDMRNLGGDGHGGHGAPPNHYPPPFEYLDPRGLHNIGGGPAAPHGQIEGFEEMLARYRGARMPPRQP